MVLKMTRPTKHPDTGIYQLRKRVPKHLIPLVGRSVIKVSLKTRDRQEAIIAHSQMIVELETRWRQLSVGVLSLSQRQSVAMAGDIYREIVAVNEEDPGTAEFRKRALFHDHFHLRPEKGFKVAQISKDDALVKRTLEAIKFRRNDPAIKEYLGRHGYRVDDPSMELLRKAVAEAVMQAKEHLLKLANGDYRPDPDADRFPALDLAPREIERGDLAKYGLMQVFEDYFAEKKFADTSYKKWKGIIAKVAAEVPDIRDLTGDWIVDWKDRLLKKGLSAGYVNDSHLSSLRATCAWAKNNKRILANPLEGISVAIPHKTTTRQKWFTADETLTILTGTLAAPKARFSPEMQAAYRWIPWLCAYTGARVGEIAQLRKEDIQTHDGHLLIWITPEAGSTKNRNPRFVAIHPHLLEQGFMTFVSGRKPGPMFYNPSRHRGGTNGNPQYSKVGERLAQWVRKLGVTDDRIRPNHAWRHLFKTKARSVKMDVGARDYMQGHVPASEGEAYGGFEPPVLFHEIIKLPNFASGTIV